MKTSKFILLLMALVSFSCDNDVNIDFPNFPIGSNNCLPGQGTIVSENRTVGDFHSIINTIYADILLTQGPQQDIIIEGQQNIIDQIKTDVVNGELRLTLNRCVRIAQGVKVYITIPEIRNLALTGVGNIIAQNNFDLTDLNVTLSGTGDFRLQGTTTTLDISLTGVGDVKAFQLNSDICNVGITGVGDVEVFVNDELNVTITGTGTVFYKGHPTITSNITGSGIIVDSN